MTGIRPPASQGKPGPGRDSKTDLLEAAQAVMKDREEKAAANARSRMRPEVRRRVSILTLIGALGALLVVLQPIWLAGPTSVPPESPAVTDASVRLGMLRERQRIIEFARVHGRLPATLSEAGSKTPGLGYEPGEGQTFKLFAQSGDSLLLLHSTDSMSTFLGNSLQALKNRGRP
ncbi:MAG TPA: hypothetical protein VF187_09710 [Gemmatimonadales bacterium]